MNYQEILKEIDLFSGLSAHQLARISELCKEKSFKKDEVIFQENSGETDLYIVLDGSVVILVDPSLVSSDINRKIGSEEIAILRRGQIFGEMALADEGIRSASAKAMDETTQVLQIERRPLLELCKSDTDLGFKIMFNLCNDLALKIRNADLQIRATFLKKDQEL